MRPANDVRLATDKERLEAVDRAEQLMRLLVHLETREATNALIVAMALVTMMRFGKLSARSHREAWVEDMAEAAKKTMRNYEGGLSG